MHDTHAYWFRKYTANSQHICHIYVVGNNLVQIDDNMCTMAVIYTSLLHPATYLILHYMIHIVAIVLFQF